MFDRIKHPEFNDDSIVLTHEVAHAVVWFSHGEGLGRLRLLRHPDGLLEASVVCATREEAPQNLYQTTELLAHRLLAGESAARRKLNFPRDEVCPFGPDFENIVKIHRSLPPIDFRQWLAERLTQTQSLVDQNWDLIDDAAANLTRHLPRRAGKERIVAGMDLIFQLQRIGVSAAKLPPTEIVVFGEEGNRWTRLKRFIRQYGRQKISVRYIRR